jgi:hypothetical protein
MKRRWPPLETDIEGTHCQGGQAVNLASLVDVIGRLAKLGLDLTLIQSAISAAVPGCGQPAKWPTNASRCSGTFLFLVVSALERNPTLISLDFLRRIVLCRKRARVLTPSEDRIS